MHFLKFKDETIETFKIWKNIVEKQSGKRIKVFKINNGLEFCNEHFDSFCKEEGILKHGTIARTLQRNGLAKRMIRTNLERARFILSYSSLPKTFWVDAIKIYDHPPH